jgi:uncharacterized protein
MRVLAACALLTLAPGASATEISEMHSEYLKGDHEKTLRIARSLADEGNTDGLYMLGIMQLKGEGTPSDVPSALERLKRSAGKGHVRAQHDLGLIYGRGEFGVTPNSIEAIKWYTLAADQGEQESTYNLGVLHFTGEGVAIDRAEGCRWFEKSARLGYAAGQFAAGECYEKGFGRPKDAIKAKYWYDLAKAQGYTIKDLLNQT